MAKDQPNATRASNPEDIMTVDLENLPTALS